MIKQILVCLDGSDYGEAALQYGIALAKQFQATLHGLHVVDIVQIESPLLHDLVGATGATPYFNLTAKMRENLELWGQQVLAQFGQACESAAVPYVEHLVTGVVPTEIIHQTAEVDLILLGRGGLHTELSKAILGSAMETVARRATKPTMVVPQRYQDIRKPLVATDASPLAEAALRTAALFASALNVPLHVVHCSSTHEAGEQPMAQTQALLKREGIAGSVACCQGNSREDLLQYMHDNGYDALFIGAFGHHRMVEWILGSTTQYLLRSCPDPLILCHKTENKQEHEEKP